MKTVKVSRPLDNIEKLLTEKKLGFILREDTNNDQRVIKTHEELEKNETILTAISDYLNSLNKLSKKRFHFTVRIGDKITMYSLYDDIDSGAREVLYSDSSDLGTFFNQLRNFYVGFYAGVNVNK